MNHSEDKYIPKLIAWEITRRCNMKCTHCRAGACDIDYPGEFTTSQCYKLLDNIATLAKPIIILTGGEPMMRDDIFQVASYGASLGMRMVMAPCGMLIDDDSVKKMIDSGISCISLSIDGANAQTHDTFRNTPGAFDSVIKAANTARAGGMAFQINTTITRHNLSELEDIMHLAEELGAITFNPFLLVPTGRGKELAEQELTPQQYEETLHWLASLPEDNMSVRVTCAPHFQRIMRQTQPEKMKGMSHGGMPPSSGVHGAGCMGGKSFAFISHTGTVQICGFLDTPAGELKENDLDFVDIWRNSQFLNEIRDVDCYNGKCGICEYRKVCGGCRARVYAADGDYMGSEPFCLYHPK